MSHEPLISVLTPVYNGEPYLRECIESVLAQTWTRFEYLIVDNGSTDRTRQIADEYAAAEPRIRILTPDEFVSGVANLNRALQAIDPAASYVKFVLADDWIYPRCLELMVGLAEANRNVGIVSACRRLGDDTDMAGLPCELSVLDGRDVGRSALLGGPLPYLFGSPTSVLLRADLARSRPELYSLENPHQADQEACLDLLRECDLGFVHEVLTFTRRHDQSQSYFFDRVAARYPCSLRLLLKYGGSYLSLEEYRRKLAVRIVEYALYVLARPWKLAGREFRSYHAGELRTLAPHVRPRDLTIGLLRQARRQAKPSGRRSDAAA